MIQNMFSNPSGIRYLQQNEVWKNPKYLEIK